MKRTTSNENRSEPDSPPPSVPEVFRRALPLLRSVFREYRIPEATARSAENDLTAWFVRFCRRNPQAGVDAQILALLSLACSFSRGHARIAGGDRPADRILKSLLGESPEAVAERIASPAGIASPGRNTGSAWSRLVARVRGGRG